MGVKKDRRHNMYGTPEYRIWSNIIQRCLNPKNTNYGRYGAKGVVVSEEWRDFRNFYRDMGPREAGMEIDRINNNLGYCKENCRWATSKEQTLNRRTTVLIEAFGRALTTRDWGRENGLSHNTIFKRLKLGWPAPAAVSLPPGSKKPDS